MIEVRVLGGGSALYEDDVFSGLCSFGVGEEHRNLRILPHMLNLPREENTRSHDQLSCVRQVEGQKWESDGLAVLDGCELTDKIAVERVLDPRRYRDQT